MNKTAPVAIAAKAKQMSFIRGDFSNRLCNLTIPQVFAQTVAAHGDREAAVFFPAGIRLTYRELNRMVDELATGLMSLGLSKGDRIGILAPNRYEWLTTQFAAARIGLILVNINPAYRINELEYALNKVECKALVTAEKFKSSNYIDMLQTLAPELSQAVPGKLNSAKLPSLRFIIKMGPDAVSGMLRYDDVVAMGRPARTDLLDAATAELHPLDPINVQFTSGTTGSPKGATLTHHNLVNNCICATEMLAYTHMDRVCIPVPLYHCFGMVIGTLACAVRGSAMIFPDESFDPRSTLAAVAKERCTSLYGVPTMFAAELAHPDFETFDLRSLRTGIMAGAPCPIELMKRVVDQMHMREVAIAYGMTETSPLSFMTSRDDLLEKRVGTVGRVFAHVEAKIVDLSGNVVPQGEQGEVCTRGYVVMHGYWNDPEKTRESVDRDGWMHTGDLGTLDEQGYLNITGRLKDMLIRGGENIFPREIEEFLYTHPKISQVQVFGIPDDTYGEEVCAWIVPKADEQTTEEEIKQFCRGKIAHFKIPRYVRFVTEMPMTVTGKAQKFRMRELMIKELGLNVQATA